MSCRKSLQLDLFDERDLAEITAPDYPGERLVVCRNAQLAAERRRKRKDLLAATERALSRIVMATRRKRARRRSDDGTPLISFRDLLRHLATMTLNRVAAPINERYTLTLVSKPTGVQRKAFDLLGIKPLRVQ